MKSALQGAAFAALFLFLAMTPAPAHAVTPAWVQNCSGEGNNVQTQTCTPSTNVTAGDAVWVMAEMAADVTSYTVTDGLATPLSLIRSDPYMGANAHTNNIWCGIAPSTGSDPVTAHVTSGTGTHYADLIIVMEFSGVPCSAAAQNVTTGTTTTSSQTVLSTALSSTAPNQMMVQFACMKNGIAANYAGTSWAAGQVGPQPLRDDVCTGAHLLASSVGSYQAPYAILSSGATYEIQFLILGPVPPPPPAPGQTAYWTDTIRDFSGQAVQNTPITVCALGASGIPCAPALQRTNTDAIGNFHLVIASGNYVICAGTSNLPFNALCWNQTIGGAGGGSGTLTGTGTPCSIAKWIASSQLANSTGCDDGINPVLWPNGLSVAANAYYIQKLNSNSGTAANLLVKLNSSGQAVTAGTSDTTNIFGVAGPGAGTSGNVSIAIAGQIGCVFDNQTTAQDWVVASTTVGGDCHDAGASETTGVQNFARVGTVNGGAGTQAIIDLYTPDVISGSTGSGLIDPAVQYSAAYYAATGTASEIAGVAPPTTPNVSFNWCSTPSGGVATAPAWCLPGIPVNAQSGTTYPVATTDRGRLITASNASAQAYSLSSPGTSGYGSNFNFALNNIGAGLVTLTPSSATINGNASQIVPQNWSLYGYSDNTNYRAGIFPSIAAFVNCPTGGEGFTSATGAFNCNSIPGTNTSKRTCALVIGADNGAALADADIAPQLTQCQIPFAATIIEIDVAADGGTPNVVVAKRHCTASPCVPGANETVSDLTSSALATAASGGTACSKTGATAGLDTFTTCSATLQNTAIAVGDWIETHTATAGGTAKKLSIEVHYTVN